MDDFGVITNFKSSQPEGCCVLKFALALNSSHIFNLNSSSKTEMNYERM